MESFDRTLRRALADRDGPEATELFRTLLGFVERRVIHLGRTRCRGLLTEADHEEVLGEVLFQLMEGALARFRGDSMDALLAFVRTMTDRIAVRRAQRKLRERTTVQDLRDEKDARWVRSTAPAPDAKVEFTPESPLDVADADYLADLIRAGSKAALARSLGVSRAAVTQRVARIEQRIERLGSDARTAHRVWMHQVAEQALAVRPEEAAADA